MLHSGTFKACDHYLFIFYQKKPFKKSWKMLFISTKELISFSRYFFFCIFPFFFTFSRFTGSDEAEIIMSSRIGLPKLVWLPRWQLTKTYFSKHVFQPKERLAIKREWVQKKIKLTFSRFFGLFRLRFFMHWLFCAIYQKQKEVWDTHFLYTFSVKMFFI